MSEQCGERAIVCHDCRFDVNDFARALKPFLKEACEEACRAALSAHMVGLESLALRVSSLEQQCAGVTGKASCRSHPDNASKDCQARPDMSSCSGDSTRNSGSIAPNVGQEEMFEWDDILCEEGSSSSNLATMSGAELRQDPASSYLGSGSTFDCNHLDSEALCGSSAFDSEYSLSSDDTIRIRELPLADGVHASTGCQLWPASRALGHFLHRESSLIAGKSVIELGAGCGFAGIVAAKYASRCIITDADQETVFNLRYNLLANRNFWLSGRSKESLPEVVSETLLWEEVAKTGWPPARRADVVIGSDIIYGNWGALVTKVVQNIMVPSGTVIMISATDRGGLIEFKTSMEGAGFDVDLSDFVFDGKRFLLYRCGPRRLNK